MTTVQVLNFSHPISAPQLAALSEQLDGAGVTVRDVRVQFDLEKSFVAQVTAMVDDLGITSQAWQSDPMLIVLPSLNYISAVLLAEIHGRMGRFPSIVRMKPKVGAIVTEFEIAEVINLDQVRQAARNRR